uniref:Armadillo repeat containing 5 n=1 Tax=Oryzias melastigma TaxID=30732 RepID=A0A3B3DTC8_ORYME
TAAGRPAESSLSWCLAHLHRCGSGTENQVDAGAGKEMDKRFRVSQWRALVAIRTQHIKAGKAGIAKFRDYGGLRPLMNLLKHSECPRKTLDLALSILGNCCTELDTRREVRCIDIMKRNVTLETVLNRAARALGNLAMDPDSSHLIHSAGNYEWMLTAPPTDSCLKLECAQSAARALLYLSDTPSSRLSLITQGAFSALAPLIAPEYPQGLRRASLKTLHELSRGCGVECAREVSRSGVLAQLGVMVSEDSGKGFEELALKTLANVCAQGCLRPLVGSLGVIPKFTEEIKKDPLKSGVFLKALCLCCKEAVNRAKVKESGGLEVLVSFLSSHQNHSLSRLAILACVDFVFDEAAMEQLQEFGLVPLLVARLVRITREEEQTAEKLDASSFSSTSAVTQMFLLCRSWLLSEGLISSEGDLLDSSRVDGECLPSSSPSSSSSLKIAHSSKSAVTPSASSSPHPYHPEPWTPESPVLLLLSRFSHAGDPSAALVSSGVMSGLLYYLTQHQDPSSRCFRLLSRLSCNPNCLQALVRTGSVLNFLYLSSVIRKCHKNISLHLFSDFIGVGVLNNLRVQCESGFGSGVVSHVMLSGSESDRMNCALSLPFLSRKLLLDTGGLLLALKPLGLYADADDEEAGDEDHAVECGRLLPDLMNLPPSGRLHSLYVSLLIGCLSALTVKTDVTRIDVSFLPPPPQSRCSPDGDSAPPLKKPRLLHACPYALWKFDLFLLLDDGSRLPVNRAAVGGVEGAAEEHSPYFRALLRGGFGEAHSKAEDAIRIKDTTTGMLLPLLHYLHGCRFGGSPAPLGEAMIGACRFLVDPLQKELEDLCLARGSPWCGCEGGNRAKTPADGRREPASSCRRWPCRRPRREKPEQMSGSSRF